MVFRSCQPSGSEHVVTNTCAWPARLDPWAGTWIQAEGEYTDQSGEGRRVAVSIGPEHGTVGPTQVKEAAKGLQERQYLYWRDDIHWNVQGTEVAAAAIRDGLRDRLRCP